MSLLNKLEKILENQAWICDRIRNQSVPIQKDSVHNSNKKYLINCLRSTREFINDNPNVLITKANKGNITVMLNRDEYTFKMEAILLDEKTY